MRDLRDHLAERIVDVVAAESDRAGRVRAARRCLESSRVPVPDRDYVTSRDVSAIAAFLAKYPEADCALSACRAEAAARGSTPPDIELMTDPEVCGVCTEAQSLTVTFRFPPRAQAAAFQDWWLDSIHYRPVIDLLLVLVDPWQ